MRKSTSIGLAAVALAASLWVLSRTATDDRLPDLSARDDIASQPDRRSGGRPGRARVNDQPADRIGVADPEVPGDTPTSSKSATAPVATAANPAVPAWAEVMSRQKEVQRKLLETPLTVNWSQDTSLASSLERLSRDIGVSISVDPALSPDFSANRLEANFIGAAALEVLRFVADAKGVSLQFTVDGVLIVPLRREPTSADIVAYRDDPLTAMSATRTLWEWDRGFHRQWRDVAACELDRITLDDAAEIPSWQQLIQALPPGSPHRSAIWSLPLFKDRQWTLPTSQGDRAGTAAAVVRSWCPSLEVITGRRGIEVWFRSRECTDRRVDKEEYERVRTLLNERRWPVKERWEDVAVRDVASAAAEASGSVLVLDPDVERVLPVRVKVGMTVLDALEASSVAWTYAAGYLAVTTRK